MLTDAECPGSLPQIWRLDPKHSAIASGPGAEGLHRNDVDVRLGELLRDLGDCPLPIVALRFWPPSRRRHYLPGRDPTGICEHRAGKPTRRAGLSQPGAAPRGCELL